MLYISSIYFTLMTSHRAFVFLLDGLCHWISIIHGAAFRLPSCIPCCLAHCVVDRVLQRTTQQATARRHSLGLLIVTSLWNWTTVHFQRLHVKWPCRFDLYPVCHPSPNSRDRIKVQYYNNVIISGHKGIMITFIHQAR